MNGDFLQDFFALFNSENVNKRLLVIIGEALRSKEIIGHDKFNLYHLINCKKVVQEKYEKIEGRGLSRVIWCGMLILLFYKYNSKKCQISYLSSGPRTQSMPGMRPLYMCWLYMP